MLDSLKLKSIINKIVKVIFTRLIKKMNNHLSLSFKVGGLKPLLDIKNKALIGCKSNIGG
jgi:hypothetical protein